MGSAKLVGELCRHFLSYRDGEVAVLTAYMDESGIHDGSPVLTVAAYLGRPEDWAEWTRRWVVAKWPIKVYHATDAANFEGEFKDWSVAARDTLVKRLLPVLADSVIAGMVVGIHMDEFRRALAGQEDLKEFIGVIGFPVPRGDNPASIRQTSRNRERGEARRGRQADAGCNRRLRQEA